MHNSILQPSEIRLVEMPKHIMFKSRVTEGRAGGGG